jgi:hypothetical protein
MSNPPDAHSNHSDKSAAARVEALAEHAALPLDASRLQPVAQVLMAWIDGANALSAKMSAPRFAAVTPIVGLLQTIQHGEVTDER